NLEALQVVLDFCGNVRSVNARALFMANKIRYNARSPGFGRLGGPEGWSLKISSQHPRQAGAGSELSQSKTTYQTYIMPSSRQKKLNTIQGQNEAKRELRPVGHRSVELHSDVCLQQKRYPGWSRSEKLPDNQQSAVREGGGVNELFRFVILRAV